MNDRLNLNAEEARRLGRAAADLMAEYYAGMAGRGIMPETSSRAIRELLEEPLPEEGTDPETVLATVRDAILPLSRHNGHPRFFGYVASPGTAVTAVADMLASALNTNVTSWRSAPAPTEIEHIAVNWLKQMLGYPADAMGLFVSGGSMANLAALAAARAAKAGADVARYGMQAAGRAMRVYVSEEGHFSIGKAAALLGIGEENVQSVRTDERFRIDTADLERRIEEDRARGYLPFCVVANAGAVATGAFDPLEEVGAIARRHGLWFHVDGAYGGFAALAPSARHFFRGIEEADSVTLDPHKWLYGAIGCGSVLYRDPETARRAFAQRADYINTVGLEHDEAFVFWDYGPELSRRFRALGVWMQIKSAGTRALGAAIERNIACAKYFEGLVLSSEDFEMLAPVELSIFCFRYRPRGYQGDLDRLNERILVELHRHGGSYVSNARPRGRFALRGCVLNYRTTERDMATLLDDVRRAARAAA